LHPAEEFVAMPRKMFATLWLVLAVGPTPAAQRTHDVTPDDYFTLATITEVRLSPDGKQVAFCLATWDKADDARKTDLWIVATDGRGKPTRLTFDRANDRHPKWSADGKWIYFLSNQKREAEKKPPYDGKPQVWRIAAAGGEARALTRVEGGVTGFDYAPKADALYYSKDTDKSDDDDFSKLRKKFDKVEYGNGKRKVSEVHKLDLASWRTELVIDEKRYVREFAVTRDGQRIAVISAFDDSVVKSEGESRVDVWDADTSKVTTPPTDCYRKNAASPYAWLENLAWSPDGKKFAFNAVFDAYPTEVVIGSKTQEGWKTEYLKRSKNLHYLGYGTPLRWGSAEVVYFLRDQHGRVSLVPAIPEVLDDSGAREPADRVVFGFDIDESGKSLAMIASSSAEMADLFVGELKAGAPLRKLTNVNPQTQTWKNPSVQHITWTAPDGTRVGGVLELPHGYKKGDRLPLVVGIHGGPTSASYADLRFDPHNGRLYFAARGYAVLLPNYRGSTGYGDRFVTDLIGRENDVEVKDILAGVQHLVKEGIANSELVATMGWSNGGYLTNCLITLKDPPVKFRAASSGAGIVDTVAEWGFNDEPAYPIVLKRGLPWQQAGLYRKSSPTYGLGNVTTPTLIHVGGADERCPPGHSRMLYRALREYQKVPTELIVYTGEPHGLSKLSNRKAKMEWDLAWFKKYLKSAK
jgi:dipeptidyl aminopeptidase/acylaminoacyl peptidase